jgi:hypothetical protein
VKLCQLKQDSFLGDKPLHSSLRPLFNPGFGRTTVPSDPCQDNAPPYRGRSLTVRAPFTLNVFPTSYRQDYFGSTSMRTRIPLPPEDGSPLRVNLWPMASPGHPVENKVAVTPRRHYGLTIMLHQKIIIILHLQLPAQKEYS